MRSNLAVLLAGVWVLCGWAAAPPGGLDGTRQARLAELDRRVAKHAHAGEFAEAEKLGRQALAWRQRWQGETHWKVREARAEAERWQRLTRVPAKDRPEVGKALGLLDEGARWRGRGRHPEEERRLRQALAIFRKVLGGDHPLTAATCDGVAGALGRQGKHPQAQALAEKALQTRRKVLGEEHPDTAASYNSLASCLSDQARYAQAQPLFERALATRRKALGDGHPDTAQSYNNVAFNLDAQGKHAQAQPLHEKALAIKRQVLGEGHPRTAMSYNSLASNLGAQGKRAAAQPLYEKALQIRRQALGEGHPDTAQSYNNVAFNLWEQGKHAQAQPLFEKALAICRRVLGEEHPHTATSYNNVASNLDLQGKHAQAQHLCEKALAIWEKTLGEDHPHTATSYNNLAANLGAQGKHAQAQPLYEKALRVRRRALGEEHPVTASSYHNVASNLTAQGKHAQAQLFAEKALQICRKALGEDHPYTAFNYNAVALHLSAQGKHSQARPLLEKSLQISRKVLGEDHPHTATSCNNLAHNLSDQGKHAQAQAWFERAIRICRRVHGEEHPHTASSNHNVAANLWRQGHLSRAVRLWQASRPSLEAARIHLSASGFGRSLAGARSPNPHAALAIGLARLGQPGNAFRAAEGGLARGLLDDLAAPAGNDSQEDAALLRRLDGRLIALYGKALTAGQRELREELTRQRRLVLSRLAQRAADASARQVWPLSAIQPHLAADAALVLWLDDDSLGEHWACVLRREGPPAWERLPGSGAGGAWSDDDRALPDRLYRHLIDPAVGGGARQRLIAALRKQRLGPLARHLGPAGSLPAVRQLLVVPTGWAATVPVEVLTGGHRVSYVPSGTVFAGLKQRHRPLSAASLLALGDPAFRRPGRELSDPSKHGLPLKDDEPQPLPSTRLEVEALARLVPRTTPLLGSSASEQQLDRLLAEGKLKGYRLLHFATHGRIDPDRPERSALLLARDRLPDALRRAERGEKVCTGELTVAAIRAGWRLDCDLVVLSACQTALGKEARGEGLLGFAQAFLQKGARSVVLSRWKVEDSATALLMVRFYENLLGKREGLKGPLPRAAALEEARQWLRQLPRREAERLVALYASGKLRGSVGKPLPLGGEEGPAKLPSGDRPFAHPFHWAAFVLIGDPD
jgi:CHAT domain-containing protein/tetratricopeptide (TPR) repeat protein